MILSVRVDNYMVYSGEVEMSLFADEWFDRFEDNIYTGGSFKALKSACIYGANNSGKTSFVNAVKCIQDVILGNGKSFDPNLFAGRDVTGFGVSFLKGDRAFSYDFKYDLSDKNRSGKPCFIYECLSELAVDENGERVSDEIFLRDTENGAYRFKGDGIPENAMAGFSTDNILIHVANEMIYKDVAQYRDILIDFADSLDVIDVNHIPFYKTLETLKNDSPIKEKVLDLIKKADLDIDSVDYLNGQSEGAGEKRREINSESPKDYGKLTEDALLHLYSVHRGKVVPSVMIESEGTMKIIALAGYIVDALQNGKTLVADDFGNGMHFIVTRDLVALFNNEANDKGGQLIFCTHDMTLLDLRYVFRPDQIWFVCKDSQTEDLYSLADIEWGGKESGDIDLIKEYRKGNLSIIPEPDFLSIILDGYEGDDSECNKTD